MELMEARMELKEALIRHLVIKTESVEMVTDFLETETTFGARPTWSMEIKTELKEIRMMF